MKGMWVSATCGYCSVHLAERWSRVSLETDQEFRCSQRRGTRQTYANHIHFYSLPTSPFFGTASHAVHLFISLWWQKALIKCVFHTTGSFECYGGDKHYKKQVPLWAHSQLLKTMLCHYNKIVYSVFCFYNGTRFQIWDVENCDLHFLYGCGR